MNGLVPRSYTPTSAAGRRLASAFEHATEQISEQSMSTLNNAAIDFVAGLRVSGAAPERVIVALKSALRSGHRRECSWLPSLDVTSDWASARNESTVYSRLFGWCIAAYYDEPSPSARRRLDARPERPSQTAACGASL